MIQKKWYVVYTRPRYEKRVEKYLSEKDIECYLPLVKSLRKWSDRKKWVDLPLFSSYVFIRINEKQHFDVLNTQGVVRFISFEGKPAVIHDKQIEEIKWLLSNEVETETVDKKLEPGTMVEIIKGPLRGFKAEMIYYNNKKNILIRLEQLGKVILVKVSENQVVEI